MNNPNSGNRIRDRLRSKIGGTYKGPVRLSAETPIDFDQEAPELESPPLPPIPSPLDALTMEDDEAEDTPDAILEMLEEDPFARED